MGKMLLADLHQLQGVFRIITGDNNRLRRLCACGAQQFDLCGIAVIDLITVLAHQVYRADVALKHRHAHFICHQQTPDHLPKPPEAHHNHLRFIVLHKGRFMLIFRGIHPARQLLIDKLHEQRRGHHRQRHGH